MLCTCSPRGSPLSQETECAPQRGNVGVQHPTFSRAHPRKHPTDPPEHLERSVGLRPGRGPRAGARGAADGDALARMFCFVK
eukprot:3834934-Prymnesium_polylepis.1